MQCIRARNTSAWWCVGILIMLFHLCCAAAEWEPLWVNNIKTTWGEQVTPTNAWQEYPRPAMVREQWVNLNGLWEYAITDKDASTVNAWQGKILVPFALESALSGARRLEKNILVSPKLTPKEALWYQRHFQATPTANKRTLLHFEAVDYQCWVTVNGKEVGTHVGGSTPFSFDVTKVIITGDNVVTLRVLDETDGYQLKGKQDKHPGGITYTRVSGIWQTVWMEEVSDRAISSISTTWNALTTTLTVQANIDGLRCDGDTVRVAIRRGEKATASGTNRVEGNGDAVTGLISVVISSPLLWSPIHPNLYDLRVELVDAAGQTVDSVGSYAGLRTVGKMKDTAGNWIFTLNGSAIFHWGPLDQGWWPDGLLTPPSEEAMRSDIEFLKAAGFNMIRKHIKIEPRRYYYDCDRLGMMLWQDQVSAIKLPKWTKLAPNPQELDWPNEAHAQWVTEYKRMVDHLRCQPSIVIWTPFNERWGQHRTMDIGAMAVAYDSTRLINIASGGNFFPVGDIVDQHNYPHPDFFYLKDSRFIDYIKVVGEFGGHGYPVEGHLWNPKAKNWGYGGLPKDKDEWIERYTTSIKKLAELKSQGICGGVYTQTSDVEGEINGLMTYDRAVQKLTPKELASIHDVLGILETP